jgi:hypothetical protein
MAEKAFTVYGTRKVDLVATVYAETAEEARKIAEDGDSDQFEWEYCDINDEVTDVREEGDYS